MNSMLLCFNTKWTRLLFAYRNIEIKVWQAKMDKNESILKKNEERLNHIYFASLYYTTPNSSL